MGLCASCRLSSAPVDEYRDCLKLCVFISEGVWASISCLLISPFRHLTMVRKVTGLLLRSMGLRRDPILELLLFIFFIVCISSVEEKI